MTNNKRSFSLPVDPDTLPTAQQKGVRSMQINGHTVIQHYTKNKVKKAADKLLTALRTASENTPMHGTPETDWFINVVFVFPLPASYPRWRYGTYKRTRPDGDNLLKMLLDVITRSGLYWSDDAQVQIGNVLRRYQTDGEQPRILVSIVAHNATKPNKE